MKLSVETRNHGDVLILHCHGRIVCGDAAAAFSRAVAEILPHTENLVLDLGGVSSIDGAGIGELLLVHVWAREKNVNLKCANPSSLVRNVLRLTSLHSVLEIHPSVESAIDSLEADEVCADC